MLANRVRMGTWGDVLIEGELDGVSGYRFKDFSSGREPSYSEKVMVNATGSVIVQGNYFYNNSYGTTDIKILVNDTVIGEVHKVGSNRERPWHYLITNLNKGDVIQLSATGTFRSALEIINTHLRTLEPVPSKTFVRVEE